MNHLQHIQKNKKHLEFRSRITRLIREFFWEQGFLEVETPIILRIPGQEPYLSPMKLNIHDEKGKKFESYLHTSPEYTMKKMLAAGFENIFSVCKCFRDYESFGGLHNPEFTMLEWYRAESDMFDLMEDVERLFLFVLSGLKELRIMNYELKNFGEWRRVTMKELWLEVIDVDLDEYLSVESMRKLCLERGYNVEEEEKYEDLFYRVFLNEIEPKLSDMGNVIVYHYPAQMAALAKLLDGDSRYAERFEVYIDGVELANAFSELTDADEQLRRLQEERELRGKLGKDVYDIDMEFIEAVKQMPKAAGIALGVDRMVQILLGCQDINDVVGLPATKLF